MGTRSYADVAPTAGTIALNAYIHGYGGHSLVTPHAALKKLWWTDERIEKKVARPFVISKLRGEERGFLNRPLAFGEGLTDDTYMEWILERAKRLFLILTEIGVPEQIFGCIDDSWDDDDLPVPLENVPQLELSYENDEVLNKKFYDMQFVYLLRELKRGAHIDYGPKEHIPMEYVNTIPPAVALQTWDRVHLPSRPEEVFMRRKFSLAVKETGHTHAQSFRQDVRKAQALPHEHIASVWGSYTSENKGYVVSDFVGEHTLATFIDHRMPPQYMRVPPPQRPLLLMEWMHCLSDALASIHYLGEAHTAIRPSNIVIKSCNTIAFSDIGSIPTFQRGKNHNKIETYNYAAPELQINKTPPSFLPSSPPMSSLSAFNKVRKLSSSGSSSSGGSSTSGSTRSSSVSTPTTASPTIPQSPDRAPSVTSNTTALSYTSHPKPHSSFRNFSRHLYPSATHTSGTSDSSYPFPHTHTHNHRFPQSTIPDPTTLSDLPDTTPQMCDIFSLACIYLDILTFLLNRHHKLTDFVKFRSSRINVPSHRLSPSAKPRIDSSFHAAPEKISAWIEILDAEADKHEERVFRGVPAILDLIRLMMAQNAVLRPSAKKVRDQLQAIMTRDCGMEKLCCADREWQLVAPPATPSLDSVERSICDLNVGQSTTDARDESISPSTRREWTSVAGDTVPDGVKIDRDENVGPRAGCAHSDDSGAAKVSQKKETEFRRRSTASVAAAKVGLWKSAFGGSSRSSRA